MLKVDRRHTIKELAAQLEVEPYQLWLPLDVFSKSRSRSWEIAIPRKTPFVLYCAETEEFDDDRERILRRLKVPNTFPTRVTLGDIPVGYEFFVRWDRTPNFAVPANTQLVVAGRPNVAASPAVSEVARSVASPTAAVPAAAAAATVAAPAPLSRQEAEALRKRLREELDAELEAALPRRGAVGEVFRAALQRMKAQGDAAPLYRAREAWEAPDALVVSPGVRWSFSERYVLYTLLGAGPQDHAEVLRESSRQLAVFFIDDVLLRREAYPGAVLPASGEGSYVATAASKALVERMRALARRAYRIVWLDHYPALHHADRCGAAALLRPITSFFEAECGGDFPVTVALSAVSYVTPGREGERYAFPEAKLWRHFVAHLNRALTPDPATSFVVGTSNRPDAAVFAAVYRDVAANAKLRYVEVNDFLNEAE